MYDFKELHEYSLWDKKYNLNLGIEFILLRDTLSPLIVGAVLQNKSSRYTIF